MIENYPFPVKRTNGQMKKLAELQYKIGGGRGILVKSYHLLCTTPGLWLTRNT